MRAKSSLHCFAGKRDERFWSIGVLEYWSAKVTKNSKEEIKITKVSGFGCQVSGEETQRVKSET